MYFDQVRLKPFQQPPKASKLIGTLQRDYPKTQFYCAYEAGFSCYSLQRQLQEADTVCMVINAVDVPQTDKGRK